MARFCLHLCVALLVVGLPLMLTACPPQGGGGSGRTTGGGTDTISTDGGGSGEPSSDGTGGAAGRTPPVVAIAVSPAINARLTVELSQWLQNHGSRLLDKTPPATPQAPPLTDADLGIAVARAIRDGQASVGLVIGEDGIGAVMAAGKYPGIRAVCPETPYTAEVARRTYGANVLCIGADTHGVGEAVAVLQRFIETPARLSGSPLEAIERAETEAAPAAEATPR